MRRRPLRAVRPGAAARGGHGRGAAWPLVALALALWMGLVCAPASALVVGSKRFTESYILGELLTQHLRATGQAAEHKQGLGNTGILEQALRSGAVDVYPEYTGTIVRELLKREGNPSLAELNGWLAPIGLKAAVPLGFNNTYALALREADAQRLGLSTLSDLRAAQAAGLRLGLSHEFLARADGWPALKAAYALPFATPPGLDHGLAYDALAAGRVDVIDVYATDAKIGRLGLRVLKDDRQFFPAYDAVLLMRASVDPAPFAALQGRLDAATMIRLNGEVELDGRSFAEVAARFLAAPAPEASGSAPRPVAHAAPARAGLWQRLWADDFARLAGQHLALVVGSLCMAVLAGVPLGVLAWRWPSAGPWVLGATGLLQTVPSLALLAILIAWVGRIGLLPAVLALFLYALLPIVRNTHAGLAQVPHGLAQAALSLGMTPAQVLRSVQVPLAWPVVLAGIKTAAVINVGTATLAAFVGAGGFGERIVAGLAINDRDAMLAGALPAAALAVLVQALFALVERLAARQPPAARRPDGR